MSIQQSSALSLATLATLEITGDDRFSFLQGQCSCDFREVEKGRLLPGAICSLKGRVLFSFWAIPQDQSLFLVLPKNQINDALNHLKKYAVFSNVSLKIAEHLSIYGIVQTAQDTQLDLFLAAQNLVSTRCLAELPLILPNSLKVYLLLAEENALQSLSNLNPHLNPNLDIEAWWQLHIDAGYAWVFAEHRDAFQPQELHYAQFEAVSYQKGCYTGQEIVARLYFRGKLKQRLYKLEGAASTNTFGFTGKIINHAEEAVGDVVMWSCVDNKLSALAIVKNKAAQQDALFFKQENSTPIALTITALPYDVPADKEEM